MIRLRDSHRRSVKHTLFALTALAGMDERALRRHGSKGQLLVLNFHSVAPRSNPYGPSLHPDAFGELLGWFARRATIVGFRDLPAPAERDPAKPLVVLSFDDGLKDFVEHAMPVLASFGLHANQNIIGESLETGDPPWAIQLVDLLGAADTATVQRLRVPGFEHVLASGDPLAKERFGAKLTNHMKQLAPRERGPAWTAVQDCFGGVTVDKPTRMMCTADVAAAHAAGHEIGSHSYSHESMEHLDDAAFLEDFRNSCAALERAGCPHCAIYAFPNGSCRTGQSEALVREGVSHVLLVGDQPSHPRAAVHKRVTVRGDSVPELRARAVQAPRAASPR